MKDTKTINELYNKYKTRDKENLAGYIGRTLADGTVVVPVATCSGTVYVIANNKRSLEEYFRYDL